MYQFENLPPQVRSHPALPMGIVAYDVRVLPLTNLSDNSEVLAKAVGHLPSLWDAHYKELIRLTAAIGETDAEMVANLVEAQTGEAHYAMKARENPRGWVSTYFNGGLNGTQLVLWSEKHGGKLKPGIMCWQPRAVPFALLACNAAYAKGLRVCRRNKCNKTFRVSKEPQVYCSGKCRHADEQQRYRDKSSRKNRVTR